MPVRVVPPPPDGDLHALAFALNAVHGRPLTLTDRRAEAGRLLSQQPEVSNMEIARRAGLSPTTVAAIRTRLEEEAAIGPAPERVRTPPGPGAEMVPRETYIHRERPEPRYIDDLERVHQFFREQEITADLGERSVDTLSDVIETRAWSWSVQPKDGLFVARVTKPASPEHGEGEHTAMADSWSEDTALAFALAILLEEELAESRRP